MLNGVTPCQKLRENAIHAKIIFAIIHQNKMISFPWSGAEMKLSGARNSFSSEGSSPFNLTNHPKGIQLMVYSVHFLSTVKVVTFGGIPTPNSCTFTPNFLEVQKCPNS